MDIFEGAKFGDKFLTDKGNIALFDHRRNKDLVLLYVQSNVDGLIYDKWITVYNDGKSCKFKSNFDENVVSRYQKPINTKELDELAWYEAFKKYDIHSEIYEITQHRDGFAEGFKVGYLKAIEI